MKHFSKNKVFVNRLRVFALGVLLLTPMMIGVLTTITPATKVYAATIPSDAVLQKQGEATADCRELAGGNDSKICGSYYVKGYKNPTVSLGTGCKDVGIFITLCQAGFPKGQADRKIADKAATTKPPTGNLTTAQIKALAITSTVCSGFNDGGASGAGQQSCIEGYIAGYKNQSKKTACDPHKNSRVIFQNTCERGYDNGAADKAANVKNQAQQTTQSAKPVTTSEPKDNDLTCDTQFDNPLTWIICPVTKVLVEVIGALDRLINSMLFIDANGIFCTSGKTTENCEGFYNAWKGFRNIALGLMLIAGLVVLIAQALGMEVLDAYTIRKVLPRLLIVAVGITLSWTLMNFAVELSNDLGYSIGHLLRAPFDNLKDALNLSFGDGITGSFFGTVATGGAIVGGIALWIPLGGIGVLLSFAGTAALAVLVAVLTLILRQIFIIMLILIAPVAIVMYILPNTQRVYKMWWESFFKALLMFPMIIAFISVGKIFSAIALNTNNGGPINQVIGFVAYFAPYFMIPLTFRFAGGVMSTVGNAVNQQAQGGFNKLKENRQKSRAARIKAAQTGGLYRNQFGKFTVKRPFAKNADGTRKEWSSSADKLLNTLGNYTTDAGDTWRVAAGNKGGPVGRALFGRTARSLESQIERQRVEHTMAAAKQLQGRYHMARAISGQLGYFMDELDPEAQQKMRNQFGIGKRTLNKATGQMELKAEDQETDEFGKAKWRGSGNEKEHLEMASILDSGGQGAREAAKELRSSAILLDSFKGVGNEETQRTDTRFLGMMVAAEAGRLENEDIVAYHNELAESGNTEAAYIQTKQIQKLASNLRTSQKEGYGIGYRTVTKNGRTYQEAYDVYEDPAGKEAQKSFGRADTSDIVGKSEDLRRPDGSLSGWSQAMIAAADDYEMETVKDPATGHPVVKRRTKQVPVMIAGPNGLVPKLDQSGRQETKEVFIKKDAQGLLDAKAARTKIQSIEGYAQGDTGFGGQVYRIMEQAGIQPRYESNTGQIDARTQHDVLRQQPSPPPDPNAPGHFDPPK